MARLALDGYVEPMLGPEGTGLTRQGLQTAVRRVRPPYCSLGNRYGEMSSGMALWGTVSWVMAGLLGLRLTPQALNFIY